MSTRALRDSSLAAVCLVALASTAARALPPAKAYARNSIPVVRPNAEESEIANRIRTARRQRGLADLEWDGRLSTVAREHSEDMAEHDYFDHVSPRLGDIEYRLHRAGVSLPNVRYAIYRNGSVDMLMAQLGAKDDALHLTADNRFGVGVATTGRSGDMFTTLILYTARTDLEPFPTMPVDGKKYRLSGRLDSGLRDLKLVVTVPPGDVVEADVPVKEDRAFEAIVAFNRGKGRYAVELMAVSVLGPTVLDLMRCYAGVPYPPPAARTKEKAPTSLGQAERDMVKLINRSRLEAGVGPVAFDQTIADVARGHSADMVRNKFFAHTSVTHGDIGNRMERAGLAAQKFAECIANTKSLEEAHRSLMNSPAHRRSILQPGMDRVGVGIVEDGTGGIMVTEVFAQSFVKHDTTALAEGLVQSINEARRARGLGILRTERALSEVAEENSTEMAQKGELGHKAALRLLQSKRLSYAVQIAVVKSVAPPAGDRFEKFLDADFRVVGVGVAQSGDDDAARPLWTTVLFGE